MHEKVDPITISFRILAFMIRKTACLLIRVKNIYKNIITTSQESDDTHKSQYKSYYNMPTSSNKKILIIFRIPIIYVIN